MNETFPSMAENNIIGWLLIDPEAVLPLLLKWTAPADCVKPEAKALFSAACELSDNGQRMDVAIIHARAMRNGAEIPEDWIRSVMSGVPDKSHIEEDAQIVHDEALTRAAADIGHELAFGEISPEDAVGKLQDVVAGRRSTLPTPAEQIKDYFKHLFDTERKPRTSTGIPSLDNMTGGGFPHGQVTTGAGRPGVGKTDFGIVTASNVARAGGRVLFFSLEMTADAINDRRLAALTGFTTNYIENKLYIGHEDEEKAVASAVSVLYDEQLIVYDKPCTLADIERHIRAELPLDLIVIDHMGHIVPDRKDADLYHTVTMQSHALMRIAKTTDVPILLLSQLNRQVEQRDDKRPRLNDLRQSGAIEEDSNIVLLLYRDGYYRTERPGPFEVQQIEINVAKNRGGQTGVVMLDFVAGCCRITDPSTGIRQTDEHTPFEP